MVLLGTASNLVSSAKKKIKVLKKIIAELSVVHCTASTRVY
jgi:hypothetical protein